MGISAANQNTTATTNLHYSAFLGMLYVSTKQTEDAITAAKAAVGGEPEVKKGYQGSTGGTPSAKAIAMLKESNVTPVTVSGRLTSTRVIEREIGQEGKKTKAQYLNVRLRDDDGVYNISLSLAQRGAQMLARKLANATPGATTEIKLFATYAAKAGATTAYAEHGASLKQDGQEVKGVNPVDELKPRVDAALEACKSAGIDDKETLNKRRNKVELDYHIELMGKTEQKFTEFYASRELPADDDSIDGSNEQASMPAPEEEIPA